MNWIVTYLKPLKTRIAKGISIKIIGTVAELLIPFLLSYILEHVIVSESVGRILFFGGLMVACAVVACIGNITANRMAAKTTMLFATPGGPNKKMLSPAMAESNDKAITCSFS